MQVPILPMDYRLHNVFERTMTNTDGVDILEELLVPRELVGSTYTDAELLTSLYLENQRLRERLGSSPSISYVEPVAASTVSDGPEYIYARQYVNLNPLEGFSHRHLVIVNNEYPDYGAEYGNGFVHRRIKEYQAAGVGVDVIAYGKRTPRLVRSYDGVTLLSGFIHELSGLLALRKYDSLSVHFLRPEMWAVLEPYLKVHDVPVHIFMHGYEADRWIRRAWEVEDVSVLTGMIDRTLELQNFWNHVVFSGVNVESYIFVSEFWRRAVEEDMDVVFPDNKVRIIHNVIDTELFDYVPKDVEQRFKLLWVRSAASMKYGADMAVEVFKAALEYSPEVEVTIIGDGKHFHLFENAFNNDSRVRIERRFASQDEIAELHKRHGIFVVPTRLDSQGVSRDEAMSSGLVPVTNNVSAIPEFVDTTSGILAPAENASELAAGLVQLLQDPARFAAMSAAAAERVRLQAGPEATVTKEIEIIKGEI